MKRSVCETELCILDCFRLLDEIIVEIVRNNFNQARKSLPKFFRYGLLF